MEQKTTVPASPSSPLWERWEAVVREPVQRFSPALWEAEVTALLGWLKSARRAAVEAPGGRRTGHGKPRRFTRTTGTLTVRRPRGRGLADRFVSRVRPWCKRRARAAGELLPTLSWPGLALGDVGLALRGLRGDAAPRSPAALARLQAQWPREDATWKRRRLDALEVVSVWADGLYVQAGLAATKAAVLGMRGALARGQEVVLAVASGQRESQASWGAGLRARRARGLQPWRGTTADGQRGLWVARADQQPTGAEQRGGNHRLTHGLEALPQKPQAAARTLLWAMPYADTPAACEALRAQVEKHYDQLAPQAGERLGADGERLVPCSQCPREHWRPRRTTHVVDSPLAAVRLRTSAAKRLKTVASATALIWKVLQVAEPPFRRLNAPELRPAVYAGVHDVDGVKQTPVSHQEVAA